MLIAQFNSVKKTFKLYKRSFINSAKISFYYNDFAPMLLGMLARDSVAVITIYFLTDKFYDIGGWDGPELFFLYCLLYISYGLSMLFLAGVRFLEDEICNGIFDRYMVTPLSIFFQAVVCKIDLITTVSYCAIGIALFIYSSDLTGIVWTIPNTFLLIVCLISGVLIQAGLLLIGSVFSFWAIRIGQARFLLFFNIRRLAVYPVHIYPKIIKILLVYIFPFAFVNYYPATVLLEKGGLNSYFAINGFITGIIFFTIALFLWRLGLKKYKSTGN
jgi:ABC-2 type transport system permease protein